MAVSEAASQRPISSTKKSRPGSAEDPPQTDEDDKMEGSGDDGEEEEEEYEIEKILDAKRDKFGPVRFDAYYIDFIQRVLTFLINI